MLFPCLQIPKFSGVIHGAGGQQAFMWIKGNSDNLILMSCECIDELSSLCVPKFGCFIKGPGSNSISTLEKINPNGTLKAREYTAFL